MPELRTVAACTVSGRIHPYRVRLRPISAHGRDRHVPLSYTAGVVVLATVHGREAFAGTVHGDGLAAASVHGRDSFLPELYTVPACTLPERTHPYRVRLQPVTVHGRDPSVP